MSTKPFWALLAFLLFLTVLVTIAGCGGGEIGNDCTQREHIPEGSGCVPPITRESAQ